MQGEATYALNTLAIYSVTLLVTIPTKPGSCDANTFTSRTREIVGSSRKTGISATYCFILEEFVLSVPSVLKFK